MRIKRNVNTLSMNSSADVLCDRLSIARDKDMRAEWDDRWVDRDHTTPHKSPRRSLRRRFHPP